MASINFERDAELQSGGAEDTFFELLINSLADWFIDNPAVTWSGQLKEAQAGATHETFRY